MAEVRLAAIRIGFAYSTQIDFPPGFLLAGESVRMKLRPFVGSADVHAMTDERNGDSITLSLDEAQTALMKPGTYVGEAVVYTEAAPGVDETPLTDNRYIADCDYSPSE